MLGTITNQNLGDSSRRPAGGGELRRPIEGYLEELRLDNMDSQSDCVQVSETM